MRERLGGNVAPIPGPTADHGIQQRQTAGDGGAQSHGVSPRQPGRLESE
jgi:hypothetical protein